MKPLRFASRADAVRQLRAQLETGGWPRLQMLLLVMLTGASGFIASFALLASGVENMGLRYGLACGIAYLCFLGLLGVWIRWRKHDGLDLPDFPDLSSGTSTAPNSAPGWQGGGGSHGGGGTGPLRRPQHAGCACAVACFCTGFPEDATGGQRRQFGELLRV